MTGEPVCGPETLSEDELIENRENMWGEFLSRELDGPYYRERSADLSKVNVPLLRPPTGAGRGCTRAAISKASCAPLEDKWLEVHGGSHWAPFYTDYGVALQKKFFGYFLKGEKNGWDKQPRVLLNVRHPGEKFVQRYENEWPLARTKWTRFYLDPEKLSLSSGETSAREPLAYDPMGNGVTFSMPPCRSRLRSPAPRRSSSSCPRRRPTPISSWCCACSTRRARKCLFQGALDPKTPVGQGWLRASHRKLDPASACRIAPITRTMKCRN